MFNASSKNRIGILLSALLISSFTFTSRAQTSTGFLPSAIRNQIFKGVQPLPAGHAASLPGLQPSVEDRVQSRDQGLVPDPNAPHAASTVFSVLDYMRSHVTHDTLAQLEDQNSGYNRRDDFGGWIVADSSQGCLDTRGVVLVRSEDQSVAVKYKDARNCVVMKGLWHDPYAAQDYKLAKAVQIDHVVPLKHVYLTGGKDWTPQKRCYYANFTHNPFHLLAVSGHENMAKGDKSPDSYLPPNEAFQCQYVATWLKVKTIWGLVATDAEMATIDQVVRDHHCDDSKLQVTEAEIQAEQDAIESSVPQRCVDFATQGAAALSSSLPH